MRQISHYASISLLAVVFASWWLPLLTLWGCRIEPIDEVAIYQEEIAPLLEEWTNIIDDWEIAANDVERGPFLDIDAQNTADRMKELVDSWDNIMPPDKMKEYHRWMHLAMDYERQAFELMADYYYLSITFEPDENELERLHNQVIELWTLKDKALFEAKEILYE